MNSPAASAPGTIDAIGGAGVPDARGLRVAVVSDAAPERNGVGAYYRDLVDHLRAVGARVELISPRFRAGRWYGGLGLPLPGDPTQKFVLPRVSLLTRRFDRLQPQVVVVPTPGPFGMLGMFLARRRGARLIIGFHTHFERLADLNQHGRLFGALAQGYLNACNRALFRASDLVLANSPEMVDIARSIGASHAGLMGTPIPRVFLQQPPTPMSPQIGRVLFAGRLAPEKNLDAVVDAARAHPDLRFLIAGDGPLRGWLEQQAADLPNLDYIGWVRRGRILPLIDSIDALVLPSTVESFGTIALEAMARARLVIVSAHCGILSWDRLEQGLFRIRDDETLADTLTRLQGLNRATLEHKAATARSAADDINARNLRHWLRILQHGDTRGIDEPAD
ncbi:glycosyltransferase family 1 protein [Thiohalocapsa marina]|uniref:Glycosyltransferase family 1 protein n=1 Tax=Thiohalocapsa marina TaxID=424902 RepID=A0A5M8FLH1_9GAMM|nr:glycosyltransferase [Thiohalocapsa marina]KAA6185783.1 glycosyltransferase family 1 protein [Thiohalocapsa marina]